MSEANNDNPHVCDLNCAACPRRMCTGAAALARENRDDAVAGLANAAEAPHALERIERRCAQTLEAEKEGARRTAIMAGRLRKCPVCGTPGCAERRGAEYHAAAGFGMKTCDYTGTPPFADAEWADDQAMCQWCAGTGHPYADESYGMCACPGVAAALARDDRDDAGGEPRRYDNGNTEGVGHGEG